MVKGYIPGKLSLQKQEQFSNFELSIIPHLDAAYNLARWIVHNERDADDVVQESFLRAFKFFKGFRGGDSKAWLLTIVRNTCYTWIQQNKIQQATTSFDEELHTVEHENVTPETMFLQKADIELLNRALEELPMEFREALVLHELEGFSYKEVAGIMDVPIGTVMSRLSRARKRLQQLLQKYMDMEK